MKPIESNLPVDTSSLSSIYTTIKTVDNLTIISSYCKGTPCHDCAYNITHEDSGCMLFIAQPNNPYTIFDREGLLKWLIDNPDKWEEL